MATSAFTALDIHYASDRHRFMEAYCTYGFLEDGFATANSPIMPCAL